jgi:hypothetical protein
VLWDLARNLRVNAHNQGRYIDYRRFLLEEIRASESHNWKKAFCWSDPYYSKKYPRLVDRLSGFLSWLSLKFEGFFWGHGEVPAKVVRFGALIILAFAWLFWALNLEFKNVSVDSGFIDYLGYSAAAFASTNYGEVRPESLGGRLLTVSEGASGLLIFGFLAAALYRRVSKR